MSEGATFSADVSTRTAFNFLLAFIAIGVKTFIITVVFVSLKRGRESEAFPVAIPEIDRSWQRPTQQVDSELALEAVEYERLAWLSAEIAACGPPHPLQKNA